MNDKTKKIKNSDSKKEIKPKPKDLMEEYKMCHDYTAHMDNVMWKIGSILIPISLGTLTILVSLSYKNPLRFLIIFCIGVSSIGILIGWLQLFRRWSAYLKIGYLRMAEIEKEKKLWLITYGEISANCERSKDGKILWEKCETERNISEISEQQKKELEKLNFPKQEMYGLVKGITYLLISSWVFLIGIEFIRLCYFVCELFCKFSICFLL